MSALHLTTTPTCLILFLSAQSFVKTAYYDEQCPVHGPKPSNTLASFAKYFRPQYRPRTEPDQNMRHTLNQFENYPLLQHTYSNTNIKNIKLNFSSTAVQMKAWLVVRSGRAIANDTPQWQKGNSSPRAVEGRLYWPTTAPEKADEEKRQEVEVESARPSQAQLMAFKEGKQLIFG